MSEFLRPKQEKYGPSKVKIEEIDMTKEMITLKNISGKDIMLSPLNLEKYNASAKCYAFVERLQQYPMTMVDLIYTDQEFVKRFESDENFRKEQLSSFLSRECINLSTMTFPGVILTAKKEHPNLHSVIRLAMEDSAKNNKILVVGNRAQEEIKIEVPKDPSEIVPDGIVMEFIKTFYEILSKTKVKRPTDPKIEVYNYLMDKKAGFIKSGAIIINDVEASKYFTAFQTEVTNSDNQVQHLKGKLSFYITGIDDYALTANLEYRKKFGDTILNSHILDAFKIVKVDEQPIFAYAGQYEEEEKKISVNKRIGKYFEQTNDLLVPTKEKDDSDER